MARHSNPGKRRGASIGIDLRWLRREFISAIAGDEYLYGELVLKGGNALDLIHDIGNRASLDLDYSLRADVEDHELLGQRILGALRARLGRHALRLFDEKFYRRPSVPKEGDDARWGGYTAEFKVIQEEHARELREDIEALRRGALSVSGHPQAERRFRVEISKYEHCDPTANVALGDGSLCRVYAPELIAAEKLRSLCQQMDEYPRRAHPAPRARDFYDVHAVITRVGVELSEESMHDLVEVVFAAKDVPVALLNSLGAYRDFHEEDWPSVRESIPADKSSDFGFYFEFVLGEVRKLEPLWNVDAP